MGGQKFRGRFAPPRSTVSTPHGGAGGVQGLRGEDQVGEVRRGVAQVPERLPGGRGFFWGPRHPIGSVGFWWWLLVGFVGVPPVQLRAFKLLLDFLAGFVVGFPEAPSCFLLVWWLGFHLAY